jgi:addiction module HigA family antidote
MPMKNPRHPGGLVLHECIQPWALTITGAAAALGVRRTTLSELVNGKRGISPEMAVRLEKVVRRDRANLAYAAGGLRAGARSFRPDQAQGAGA